jgi:23S rRNA-/tRNA-specific pseudouridylate synthase
LPCAKAIMKAQDPPEALKVLGVSRGWIAVYKPTGLSVHNDPRQDICARVFALIETDTALGRAVGLDKAWGVHAVHRLDRDTSGVLLLATHAGVFAALSKLFSAHKVRKRYLAVVHGKVQGTHAASSCGEWTWPLSVKAGGRNRPAGVGKRRPCTTRFWVEGSSERYTLLSCEPVSGRQHQIRRHAKLAGHPVVGDRRYGSKRALNYLEGAYTDVRLALHAWQLTFVPPGQDPNETLTLTADPTPAFMTRLISDPDGLT